MPAKRLRLRSHVFTLVIVLLLAPVCVKAQTGGVTIKSTVSEVVALSVLPNSTPSKIETRDVETTVVSTGSTVRITLSGAESDPPVIRVPLLVRSNSSFKIVAAAESNTAEVTQLSVLDARATGMLVSPNAVTELNVLPEFDIRRQHIASSVPNRLGLSGPVLVASGPRVSRGGTLTSPNNALQITLLIRVKPQPARGWLVHLTFVGTAGSLIQ